MKTQLSEVRVPRTMSLVQQVAGAVGAVFLLVGILGFIPGITTNLYSGLHFAGHTGSAHSSGSST